MKSLRRIMALLIAMIMVVGATMTVFAEETTYTISVDTTKDAVTHTYKVYQIFTGTPDTKDGKDVLKDVQYGSSYPGGLTGAVPSATLEAITDARAWAAVNASNLGTEVATLDETTTSYSAVPGWYLVLDTAYTATDTTKDAYSAFMVEVVNKDTTFTPKKEVPSVDKQVKDTADDKDADSTDENGWGETADHEIGETFQFKLIATIPADANLAAYDTYMIQFNDTMSEGVTFEKINSVTVNGTTIEAGTGDAQYATTATAAQAGGSWTLTIPDIKKVDGVSLGSAAITIEVEYDAHLNAAAAVNIASGTTTNKNTVSLTYSNNPDATGAGDTDTTPTDDVWVFTYGSENTKIDANNYPVAGAGFTLKDSSGNAISLYKVGTTYYKYDSSTPFFK